MTVRRTMRGGDFGSLNTPSLGKPGLGIGVGGVGEELWENLKEYLEKIV